MTKKCKSCYYYSTTTCTCDYILLTKHSRGCSVKECTLHKPKSKSGRPFKYGAGRIKELYAQGCNDHEIGRRLGIPPSAAWRYRKKLGLPPNLESTRKKGANQ